MLSVVVPSSCIFYIGLYYIWIWLRNTANLCSLCRCWFPKDILFEVFLVSYNFNVISTIKVTRASKMFSYRRASSTIDPFLFGSLVFRLIDQAIPSTAISMSSPSIPLLMNLLPNTAIIHSNGYLPIDQIHTFTYVCFHFTFCLSMYGLLIIVTFTTSFWICFLRDPVRFGSALYLFE